MKGSTEVRNHSLLLLLSWEMPSKHQKRTIQCSEKSDSSSVSAQQCDCSHTLHNETLSGEQCKVNSASSQIYSSKCTHGGKSTNVIRCSLFWSNEVQHSYSQQVFCLFLFSYGFFHSLGIKICLAPVWFLLFTERMWDDKTCFITCYGSNQP